jgi:hypothetical protein
MIMSIFKPPKNITFRDRNKKSIFLAGSIEMGNAENWQEPLSNRLIDSGWVIFNPRRDDWDNSLTQEFETPQFYQQVTWELNALEQSDLIIMYFDPNTKSPISLLELGLYARSGKLIVVCPDGFWRKGNVDIVCNYYNVPQYQSILHFMNHYL